MRLTSPPWSLGKRLSVMNHPLSKIRQSLVCDQILEVATGQGTGETDEIPS